MITIYVIQKAGFDITVRHPPLSDCVATGRVYVLARQLGWDYWIWGFEALKDFESSDKNMAELEQGELWTLLVPKEEVRWCNLTALKEGRTPVWSWFHPSPEEIRTKNDMPIALIKAPINSAWVSKKEPAKEALTNLGHPQEKSTP
jgi:hypothetical protein